VVRQTDAARQEGAVVARIVPGEPAFIAALLPERHGPFDRLERFLAVQRDRLAVGLDLLAAPRPQIPVPPAPCIAEGMPAGLTDRPALGLQFLARVAQLVPGLRELVVAGLLKPRFTVGDESAADAPRHADPLVADGRDLFRDVVI